MPETVFLTQHQGDAFSSDRLNIRERAGNEPAPCKAELDIAGKGNPGALAGATGANDVVESVNFDLNDTASLAARHPIIALHWGIAA